MGFFRNAAGVFATSLVNIPIGIATSVILARWLSVEDRGLYSVAISFAGMAALFLQLGWPSASIYRLRRMGSQPAQVASAAIAATLGASGLLLGACVLFDRAIAERFLDGAPLRILYLGLALVPFQILASLFAGIARGIDRFRIQNIYFISLASVTLVMTAAALLVGEANIDQALAALLASQGVVSLVFVVTVVRHTGLTTRVSLEEMRESLRFGLKSYVQSLAGQIHERVDVLLLAYLLVSPEQVAIYAVAAGVIQRLKLLPDALASALLPHLAGLPEPEAARLSSYVCRHSFWWSSLITLAVAAVAPILIVVLYGEAYRASVAPFLVLLPGMLLLTVYRVLARYFTAIDKQQANIRSQALSLVANVLLNLLWIPRYGILGAAAASLLSYALAAALLLAAFRARTQLGLREAFVWHPGDSDPYRQRLLAFARRLRT